MWDSRLGRPESDRSYWKQVWNNRLGCPESGKMPDPWEIANLPKHPKRVVLILPLIL
jgi:hypothetical protein